LTPPSLLRHLFGLALIHLLVACTTSEDPGADEPVFRPVLSSTAGEVAQFIAAGEGGARVRLAYVDMTLKEGRLCFLDYFGTNAEPTIRTIAAANNPSVPVISPDGDWIAYASGDGTEAGSALSARSSVYLVHMSEEAVPILIAADSACEPRFVQTAEDHLELIYTTLAPNLGWEGFGKTLKVAIDMTGPTPSIGKPVVLADDGSYTGGLSWDGRYLGGGGGHVAMRDLQAPNERPDTLSYQGIQSCNASISSSRLYTHTLMYLNTMGQHPGLNGGKPWGQWEAILIGSREGELHKGFMYPTDPVYPLETEPASLSRVKWHHNEWSNHPYFATATVNAERYFKAASGYVNSAYQERIYLLNLRDSTYLEILRPDRIAYANQGFGGFYWPYLWVEVPADFTETPGWLDPLR
jgi:hypothetical protein